MVSLRPVRVIVKSIWATKQDHVWAKQTTRRKDSEFFHHKKDKFEKIIFNQIRHQTNINKENSTLPPLLVTHPTMLCFLTTSKSVYFSPDIHAGPLAPSYSINVKRTRKYTNKIHSLNNFWYMHLNTIWTGTNFINNLTFKFLRQFCYVTNIAFRLWFLLTSSPVPAPQVYVIMPGLWHTFPISKTNKLRKKKQYSKNKIKYFLYFELARNPNFN